MTAKMYSPELATIILDQLSEGRTLREVCRDPGMPTHSCVLLWVKGDVDGFSAKYRAAREVGWLVQADALLDIANDGSNDWMRRQTQDGKVEITLDHEHIARSRLRVDTLKWLIAKNLPKIYGEKLTLGGDPENPIAIKVEDNRPDLDAFLAEFASRVGRDDEPAPDAAPAEMMGALPPVAPPPATAARSGRKAAAAVKAKAAAAGLVLPPLPSRAAPAPQPDDEALPAALPSRGVPGIVHEWDRYMDPEPAPDR
jgi:hypothetical protein